MGTPECEKKKSGDGREVPKDPLQILSYLSCGITIIIGYRRENQGTKRAGKPRAIKAIQGLENQEKLRASGIARSLPFRAPNITQSINTKMTTISRSERIKTIVDAVLSQILRGQVYESDLVQSWISTIAATVIDHLKREVSTELKYNVSSVIIRKSGEVCSLEHNTSAYGNPDTDGHVSTTFENAHLICICMTHVVSAKDDDEGDYWKYMKPSTYLEPIISPLVDPVPVPPSTSSSRDLPPVAPAEPSLLDAFRGGFFSSNKSEVESETGGSPQSPKGQGSGSTKQRGANWPTKTQSADTGCLNCFPSESRDNRDNETPVLRSVDSQDVRVPMDYRSTPTPEKGRDTHGGASSSSIPNPGKSPSPYTPSNLLGGVLPNSRSPISREYPTDPVPRATPSSTMPNRDLSYPKNASSPFSPNKSPSEVGSAISAFDLKEKLGSPSSSKPSLDPVKLENIRLINDQLRKLANDFQVQADLRRSPVKEAMKIWGGEDTSHLSPADMDKIQGDDGVARVYPKLKELQLLCDGAKIKLPIDHVKAKKTKLTAEHIVASYGTNYVM